MTFEEKDSTEVVLFMSHQMWCEWWIEDSVEICDCGYREDLYVPEEWEDIESWLDEVDVAEMLRGTSLR